MENSPSILDEIQFINYNTVDFSPLLTRSYDTKISSEFDLDLLIHCALVGTRIPTNFIAYACRLAGDLFRSEENIIKLDTKNDTYVIGDIHGQFHDLLIIFLNIHKHTSEYNEGSPLISIFRNYNFIFLGDYVDRGNYSIETITLLILLKLKFPNSITLLRGNHESLNATKCYGFYQECVIKFGSGIDETNKIPPIPKNEISLVNKDVLNLSFVDHPAGPNLYTHFIALFTTIPLGVVLNGDIIFLHGGISPQVVYYKEINKHNRFQELDFKCVLSDLLWSDPSPDVIYHRANSRGLGCLFGEGTLNTFLAKNSLSLLVRSHQLCMNGVNAALPRALTLWSAPNYCMRYKNKAYYMKIQGDAHVNRQLNFDLDQGNILIADGIVDVGQTIQVPLSSPLDLSLSLNNDLPHFSNDSSDLSSFHTSPASPISPSSNSNSDNDKDQSDSKNVDVPKQKSYFNNSPLHVETPAVLCGGGCVGRCSVRHASSTRHNTSLNRATSKSVNDILKQIDHLPTSTNHTDHLLDDNLIRTLPNALPTHTPASTPITKSSTSSPKSASATASAFFTPSRSPDASCLLPTLTPSVSIRKQRGTHSLSATPYAHPSRGPPTPPLRPFPSTPLSLYMIAQCEPSVKRSIVQLADDLTKKLITNFRIATHPNNPNHVKYLKPNSDSTTNTETESINTDSGWFGNTFNMNVSISQYMYKSSPVPHPLPTSSHSSIPSSGTLDATTTDSGTKANNEEDAVVRMLRLNPHAVPVSLPSTAELPSTTPQTREAEEIRQTHMQHVARYQQNIRPTPRRRGRGSNNLDEHTHKSVSGGLVIGQGDGPRISNLTSKEQALLNMYAQQDQQTQDSTNEVKKRKLNDT